jgi:hypothetical protein
MAVNFTSLGGDGVLMLHERFCGSGHFGLTRLQAYAKLN